MYALVVGVRTCALPICAHRVEHVYERHFRDDAAPQRRRDIHARAHQQPAGGQAIGDDFALRGIAFVREIFGAGDEIGEAVALGEFAAAEEPLAALLGPAADMSSEEHTSELQSLMRISYAVSCLK